MQKLNCPQDKKKKDEKEQDDLRTTEIERLRAQREEREKSISRQNYYASMNREGNKTKSKKKKTPRNQPQSLPPYVVGQDYPGRSRHNFDPALEVRRPRVVMFIKLNHNAVVTPQLQISPRSLPYHAYDEPTSVRSYEDSDYNGAGPASTNTSSIR